MGLVTNQNSPSSQRAFDDRIIQVGIALQGETFTFDGSANILIRGKKFKDAIMNPCEVKIFNLTRELRNNILSQSSFLKLGPNKPVAIAVNVGRLSYGTFQLYEGTIISSNITQPPDISVTLTSMTSNFAASIIQSVSFPQINMSVIAQDIANRQSLKLDFQATDKLIDNYYHNGGIFDEIANINAFGNVIAFIDNGTLVVLNSNQPRKGEIVQINAGTGMIGIPQVTASGVIVKVMINPQIQLGCQIMLTSEMNPVTNGNYYVTGIDFEIASRDQAFWYTLICLTPDRYQGTSD